MRLAPLIVTALMAGVAPAEEPTELKSTPVAQAFGAAPVMWGVQLSPSGTRLSAIQMHPSGVTVARVVGLADASAVIVLSGNDDFRVNWCDWKNEELLLCGLLGLTHAYNRVFYPTTRLVAVKADGTDLKVLFEGRRSPSWWEDSIVDWLPDDPEHVLLERSGDGGIRIERLNVYTGALALSERQIGANAWVTDGHGTALLYLSATEHARNWVLRDTPESDWSVLHTTDTADVEDAFRPIGFAESRTELLVLDRHEGRDALFAYDLARNRERRLVYSHPTLDVAGVHTLGKYRRLVAAAYIEDRPRLHFFDARLEAVHKGLSAVFGDKTVAVIDESWDQRYYLVFVSSATDAGTYYRYDAATNRVGAITATYPSLAGRTLAPMVHVHYVAEDGVEIPAYLTLPLDRTGRGPAVILPHGGPSARDYWSYDFLAQYLAASGYAVLQSNYRGSDGYGAAWEGEGGFRGWRRVIADIAAGTQYLIDEGIADPERICTVGWSYGGYAALMTAIEEPEQYRCIVSVAGVTDPKFLGDYGGRAAAAFIGKDDEVRKHGSPLERADDIQVPVLLFHGRDDLNVPLQQSLTMVRALERATKDVELIQYERAEHDIWPERYRIDLLARLGAFLDEHLTRR